MGIRKNAANLNLVERRLYIDVINRLIANGAYGRFVSFHVDMSHNMHGSMGPVGRQRFLPWHRLYLRKLEQEMEAIDARCIIPYWRWSVNRAVPGWMAGFRPTVRVPNFGLVTVRRTPAQPALLPTAAQVNVVLNTPTFTQFTSELEGLHNTVHGWVGGTMNNIQVSPADPIFWMHHAEVDRLWSVWQTRRPNQNPTLVGRNRILDPWRETEPQVRSIARMGYSYA